MQGYCQLGILDVSIKAVPDKNRESILIGYGSMDKTMEPIHKTGSGSRSVPVRLDLISGLIDLTTSIKKNGSSQMDRWQIPRTRPELDQSGYKFMEPPRTYILHRFRVVRNRSGPVGPVLVPNCSKPVTVQPT